MQPFKRAGVRYGRTPEPETPYQRAAQAWDERIGSARVQARNWRVMAFGCLALASASTGGLIWQATRGSVVPWVVEVDRLGEPRTVAPAARASRPDDAQIAWHLAQFVRDVRAIPADAVVLRQAWLQAYDFTTERGGRALGDYARTADPFSEAGRLQVAVDVSSVIRASPDSFRVAWTERRYEEGQLIATERWSGIFTVVIQPPRDPDALRKNPLGLFIHAFDWSKELS